MVANGDIKGVTASDVVTKGLPVHRNQTSSGLSNLQPLGCTHGFCKKERREER